jgi:hypothetical protein
LAATRKRFQDTVETIRDALTAQLGRKPKFKLEASDLVDLAGGGRGAPAPSDDAPPPEDEEPPDDVEPHEVMDAEPAGPAVSSVGLLEAEFGATVVEERPRQ